MRHVFRSIAVLALLTNMLSAVDFTTKSLETEIGTMKTKLEKITAESAKEFLTTYADPDDLEKLNKKEGGVEKLAPNFAADKAPTLLKILKSIDFTKAVIDDKEKTISFELAQEAKEGEHKVSRDKITFTFKNGSWHLKN